MEKSTNRPRANPKPPALGQSVDILRELLEVERERLKIAVRIEKERHIVFPETSVIIHDIARLVAAIDRGITEEIAGDVVPGLRSVDDVVGGL